MSIEKKTLLDVWTKALLKMVGCILLDEKKPQVGLQCIIIVIHRKIWSISPLPRPRSTARPGPCDTGNAHSSCKKSAHSDVQSMCKAEVWGKVLTHKAFVRGKACGTRATCAKHDGPLGQPSQLVLYYVEAAPLLHPTYATLYSCFETGKLVKQQCPRTPASAATPNFNAFSTSPSGLWPAAAIAALRLLIM